MDQKGNWKWKEINQFLLKELNSYVAAIACSLKDKENDRMVWKLTKTELFTATSTYELKCSKQWNQLDMRWKIA